MINLKLLNLDFENICNALNTKGVNKTLLIELRDFDLERKTKKQELENIIAKQNILSKEFGLLMKQKLDTTNLKIEINTIKEIKHNLENEVNILENKVNNMLLTIPNIPDINVPIGKDEDENVILEVIGIKPTFNFQPKEHWDLNNDWLDFERGVKLAKTRFTVIKNQGAKLERALINYMLDFNAKRGFQEWNVPVLANTNTLQGTGQLPKFENDLFKIEGEDLYLIPTAEVALTNLFNDEIIDKNELPLLLTACTPCFRKEAGAAGRDTRGLIRQHQFNKVELVAITTQEQANEVFETMVNCASDLLTSLGLCHQKVQLCTGDLGFGAATTIDLEVWLPGQNKFREISSISNTKDFQARRAKIRYKDGDKNILTHTLNGSALAVGRTLVAIMENYQNEDGTIRIPEVLKPYL